MRMMYTFAAIALSPFLLGLTAPTASAQAGLDLSAGPVAFVLEVALGPEGNLQDMGGLDCDLRASRDLECKALEQRLGERGNQVGVTYRFKRWPHDVKYDLVLHLTDMRLEAPDESRLILTSNVPNGRHVQHEGLTGPQLLAGVVLPAETLFGAPASVVVRAVPVDPVWRETWAKGDDVPQVSWWQRLFQ